jgi:glutathione S-transferase
MMKVFGTIASPHVARVVLVARHKKLPLSIEWPAGGLKSAAYLAMNPIGKMPTFEHDGHIIIESEVICQYLEDLHPTPTIFPGDALARAHARTVSRVVDLYVWPAANRLFHEQLAPGWLDAAGIEASKAELAAAFSILEKLIAARPWAAGEFSLADCTLLTRVVMMQTTIVPALGAGDPAKAGPKLAAWWSKVTSDPFTSAFDAEMRVATDAYLAALRGGH